jgi:hypothetical protein
MTRTEWRGRSWACVAALPLLVAALGCNRSEKIVAAYQAHFTENCLRHQVGAGTFATAEDARPVCECAAKRFTNSYEPEELSKISEVSADYLLGEKRTMEICKEDLKR